MTPEAFRQYFQDIATAHSNIHTFQYGGLERQLNRNPAQDITYPLLFLEKPDYSFVGENSAMAAAPRAAFVVLKNANWGSPTDQDTAEDLTFQIVIDIISKLKKDYKDQNIQWFTSQNLRISAIDTLTLDGDIGWRCEFLINSQIDLCFDPLKWNF